MKKMTIVVIAVMLLAGCSGMQVKNSLTTADFPKINVEPPAGYVPVHIENPDIMPQEICLFEGRAAVSIIPDSRNGGWTYSRPAFACYKINGANSENNWHEYSQIYLPRNFSFVVVSRINMIWKMSRPYFRSYQTGANPFARRYTSITPTRRLVDCGALVRLSQHDTSSRRMDIRVDIDTRPIGAAVTNKLTEAIYGK